MAITRKGPDETERAAPGVFRWAPVTGTALFGLILVWLSLAIAMDGVFASRRPELALKVWPFGAEARASRSAQLLAERPTSPDLPRIRSLAEGALVRQPVEAKAASTLALSYAAEGDQPRSLRLHNYAEHLSRRNVEAQLLLIEESVARNDVRGALRHYDRALRVSNRVRDSLLPILVQASDNPVVSRELAPLLAVRPPWWADFLDRLIRDGSPRSIGAAVRPLRLSATDELERVRLEGALRKLTEAGELDAAVGIYREARTQDSSIALIRNGSFEEESLLPPFEWWFAGDANLAAAREAREGADGQFALSLIRGAGRTGEVANQLLQLAPGRYTLRARVGAVSGDRIDRPRIRFRCARGNDLLAELVVPEAPESGARFADEFTVPAGCHSQWLSIATASGVDAQSDTPWIDDITIEKAG